MYIATLQALGLAPNLITQNVDNLHRKALASVLAARDGTVSGLLSKNMDTMGALSADTPLAPPPFRSSSGSGRTAAAGAAAAAPRILELHGTLARVHCIEHMHEQTRDTWQDQLATLNPRWDQEAREMEVTGR